MRPAGAATLDCLAKVGLKVLHHLAGFVFFEVSPEAMGLAVAVECHDAAAKPPRVHHPRKRTGGAEYTGCAKIPNFGDRVNVRATEAENFPFDRELAIGDRDDFFADDVPQHQIGIRHADRQPTKWRQKEDEKRRAATASFEQRYQTSGAADPPAKQPEASEGNTAPEPLNPDRER